MNKRNFLFSIPIFLVLLHLQSCRSLYPKTPKKLAIFDIGEVKNPSEWKIPIDSFHVLTPYIEATHYTKEEAHRDTEGNTALRKGIVDYLKVKFPKKTYHHVSQFFLPFKERDRDFDTEYRPYYKWLYPTRNVKTSERLVFQDQKYGLLFSLVARHGTYNEIIFNLIIINNEEGTIHKVIRKSKRYANIFTDAMLEKYLDEFMLEIKR